MARFVCLLGVDDSKLEVKEEAIRGLKPYTYKDNDIHSDPSQPYPRFPELVTYISTMTAQRALTQKKTTTGELGAPKQHPSLDLICFSAAVLAASLRTYH